MTDKPFIKSMTPILVVDRIEACLPFWTGRLGFEAVVSVPEGDHIGFTILQRDGVEVMYQTRTSIRDDLPALVDLASSVVLYVRVEDLEAVISRIDPADIVVARRLTFYGADEIFLREPAGGHVVGFAQMAEAGS